MTKTTRTTASVVAALGAGALLALAPALAASAHVTASASSTAAGSYTVVTFSVPHGCAGSPTTEIEIEIPETILSVTPTVNPNWTVTKNSVPLDEAAKDAHGNNVTERVGSVTYTTTGEGLADGYRDAMELSLQLPDGEPGDVVAFPTHQRCTEGAVDWVGDEAPAIELTAGGDDSHGQGHGSAADGGATASADVLARVFGIGGLVVGAVGIVLAVAARRRNAARES